MKLTKTRILDRKKQELEDIRKKTDELAASFGSSCWVMDRAAVQHSAISISATRAVVSPAIARAYSLRKFILPSHFSLVAASNKSYDLSTSLLLSPRWAVAPPAAARAAFE